MSEKVALKTKENNKKCFSKSEVIRIRISINKPYYKVPNEELSLNKKVLKNKRV